MRQLTKTSTILIPNPKIHPEGLLGTIKDLYNKLAVEGFDLTINEICILLDCSRSFIVKLVVPEVSNIIINHHMKNTLKEKWQVVAPKGASELDIFNDDSLYYFSRNDFYRYLLEHTKCTCQAHVLSLNTQQLILLNKYHEQEIQQLEHEKKTKLLPYQVKLCYASALRRYLLSQGFDNMNDLLGPISRTAKDAMKNIVHPALGLKRFDYPEFPVPCTKLPKKFISIRTAAKRKNFSNNECMYREIFLSGIIRYDFFDGQLIRYSTDEIEHKKRGVLLLSDSAYEKWFKASNQSHRF